MGFWETIWTLVLGLTLLAFSAMAVVVSIGGGADVRRLLRDLNDQNKPEE